MKRLLVAILIAVPAFSAGEEGFVRPKNWQTMAPWVKPAAQRDLPSHFDWREKGVVNPVKDQAYPQYCGACWAFGTVAVMESVIKIRTGRDTHLSEQQLVSCRPSHGTCGGGYFAFGFYESQGANYDTDFPYQAANVSCDSQAPQHEKVTRWSYVGEPGREPTTDEMKQAIYQYGPIAATVSASGAWDSYKSGVYKSCNSGTVNHIVAIVGWDDRDAAWIVRNSHGEAFGENGYIRMRYVGSNGGKCNNLGESAAFAVYNGT